MYFARREPSATRAASAQLTVPVIATCDGVVALSESISVRLALASVLILGGVSASLVGRPRNTG